MSNQIVISSGAKVRSLEGVLTGTAGIVNSVPLGGANGVATLDSLGKVPLSQLPASVVTYLGTWNAATNTPTLTNGVGDVGDLYICNVAGTVNFGAGPITFAVGDWVIYNGSQWQKSAGASGTVTSVAVTESGDALTITGSPITTSGTINIGFAGTGSQYIKGDGTLATFPTTIDQAKRLITEVYNSTGATLSKGTVVYINGGQGNLPTVTKAQANADNTSAQTYGVVQSDITNNNNGFVVVIGSLTDIDTQAYAVGTQLYLSGTTAGAWTSTKPSAPIHLVYVGIVVRSHPTQGVVEIRIQNGYELEELHDVAISSPLNNQGIFYNSSNDLWENKSIATALGYTPANDALVVHLAGTETITGAKTFSNTTTFTDYALMDFGVTLAKTSGSPLYASTIGYANLQLVNAGSVNSLYLIDGNTTKYSSLSFNNAADYSYTFPALNGTLALLEGTQTFTGDKTFNGGVDFNNALNINNTFNLRNNLVGSTLYTNFSILKSGSLQTLTYLFSTANSSKLVFNDAANYTYTFPTTSGTIALASDLGNYVTLATTQTITGAKTIDNSINIRDFVLINGDGVSTNGGLAIKQYASAVAASTGYTSLFARTSQLGINYGAAFNTFIDGSGLTANRTLTIPDISGTLALLEGTQTFSGNKTFSALTAFTFLNGTRMDYGLYLSKGSVPSAFSGSTVNLYSDSGNNNLVVRDNSNTSLLQFQAASSYTYTFPASSGTLALTSNLSSYVPYTGATTNVDLGSNFLKARTFYSEGSGGGGSYAIKNGTTPSFEDGYTILSSNDYRLNIVSTVSAATKAVYFGFSGVTATRTYTLPDASGTLALTSNLSSYLPLTGGTLTGDLTINNGSADGGQLVLASSGFSDWNLDNFSGRFRAYYGATERFTITAAGNMGLGTTSPTSIGNYRSLTIDGVDGSIIDIRLNGSANGRIFTASDAAVGLESLSTTLPLVFKTQNGSGSTERMRITPSGNVGIGTSSPSAKLHVDGNQYVTNGTIFCDTFSSYSGGATNTSINFGGSGNLLFNSGSNERMRITSGGQTLIYNTASLYSNVRLSVKQTTGDATAEIWSSWAGDQSTTALYIVKFDNVNTTSQVFQRFVIGNGNFTAGQINANGANQAAFGSWSDIRLKENVENLPSQLNNIMALRPVEFDYKDGSGHQIGFIAQEMQEVYADAVGEDSEGFLTITGWSKTEARLVKTIQELNEIITKQGQAIEELKALINK